MKKKITIYLEDWAIKKLDQLLKSDFCKNRGFKMTRDELLDEIIANLELLIPGCQERH